MTEGPDSFTVVNDLQRFTGQEAAFLVSLEAAPPFRRNRAQDVWSLWEPPRSSTSVDAQMPGQTGLGESLEGIDTHD